MPLNDVMSVEEAAKKWDLTDRHVRNLCALGRIKAQKMGGTWIIERDQPKPFGYLPKECAECGNWFIPQHSAQLYCDDCRNK